MLSHHTADLLREKIPSRFLTVTGHTFESLEPLWLCMVHEALRDRTCVIVSSGLYLYKLSDKSSHSVLSMDEFNSGPDLLRSLYDLVSSHQDTVSVFIDHLSWLLMDCPAHTEFEYWTRHIITSLFELCIHPKVRRLSLLFISITDESGCSLAGSAEIMTLLKQCCISFIQCDSITPCPHPSPIINQHVSCWHRRSLQGSFPHNLSIGLAANKPAFAEETMITIDLAVFAFLNFVPYSTASSTHLKEEQVQPKSTFNLSLTESELDARNKVMLPFGAPEANGVRIDYTPDCFDDFDDEDPDDDLDI